MSHFKQRIGKKRGVVGVIFRDEKLLIIRRSLTVTAPGKLCLPGGTIEKGESEEFALVREMQEELTIDVSPVRLVWRSVTPWGTTLAWWLAHLDSEVTPVPNPAEVAEYRWMNSDDICTAREMLPSLPEFIQAVRTREVELDFAF
ncbi:NUDIX hydrolase [Novipirellula sp.]|uniref:NUDIX hydrolase n=1 Tax=Novipirellula TaxID=2795426 RepID=UPI0030EBC4EE|tara:strand:+ start:2385 stop:2819 length:435 start_codon:yes stop_codon:yes gene_type:complete